MVNQHDIKYAAKVAGTGVAAAGVTAVAAPVAAGVLGFGAGGIAGGSWAGELGLAKLQSWITESSYGVQLFNFNISSQI